MLLSYSRQQYIPILMFLGSGPQLKTSFYYDLRPQKRTWYGSWSYISVVMCLFDSFLAMEHSCILKSPFLWERSRLRQKNCYSSNAMATSTVIGLSSKVLAAAAASEKVETENQTKTSIMPNNFNYSIWSWWTSMKNNDNVWQLKRN